MYAVTPFAGVWIEMMKDYCAEEGDDVTPFAGVWIEIVHVSSTFKNFPSLPSRECGLKSSWQCPEPTAPFCHSLRGSVD